MAIRLDHTIVPAKDKIASAEFFAEIFGLTVKPGYFAQVQVNDSLTLDFADEREDWGGPGFDPLTGRSHHYAFQVGEAEFDGIFERVKAKGIPYGSEPHSHSDGRINTRRGGQGFYFEDPYGHLLEVMTVPETGSLAPTARSEPMASKAKSNVKAIPDGHRTVTPYLAVKGAAKALEFYKRAFGATETYRLMMPDGRVGHAEIRLGDSLIMVSDELPEFGGRAPDTLGGTPVNLHLYVEDVDAFVKRALEVGATERKPVTDQFYGDRSGQLEDPFGHLWWVASHKEDVPPDEMQKRVEAMFAGYK